MSYTTDERQVSPATCITKPKVPTVLQTQTDPYTTQALVKFSL